MRGFVNHFSSRSDDYQLYRPTYPEDLFLWLSEIVPSAGVAWDCATGTGQVARQLAPYFDQVVATDASQQQIEQAEGCNNVVFSVAAEENQVIDADSIDLITVGQALHWFNRDIFYDEVERVLKPDGILAVWSYNLLSVTPAIDQIIHQFYHQTLADDWPAERRLVEAGYQAITLPFSSIDTAEFRMQENWDLVQLMGYLSTWSAVKCYFDRTGEDPLMDINSTLRKAWGEPTLLKQIVWPLCIKVCQKPATLKRRQRGVLGSIA